MQSEKSTDFVNGKQSGAEIEIQNDKSFDPSQLQLNSNSPAEAIRLDSLVNPNMSTTHAAGHGGWDAATKDPVFHKTQQQFPNINNSAFQRTQNSFFTGTTTPIQRPSILQALKSDSATATNYSVSNTFKNRSHSLNMPYRQKEEQRVLRENHKLLLKVGSIEPTADLSRTNLKK